jgi:hypothetical protein
MGTGPNELDSGDLRTPVLKSEHYTTGRGGSQCLPMRKYMRFAKLY